MKSVLDLHGGVGSPPRRDTRALEKSYGEVPWLRVSGRIADQYARVRWYIAWPNKGGNQRRRAVAQEIAGYAPNRRHEVALGMAKEGEVRILRRHPLLSVIQDGNEELTGFDQRRTTSIHVDLVGTSYSILVDNAFGVPATRWIIPPSWCTETPTSRSPFFEFRKGGFEKKVHEDQVLVFKDPDPSNPYASMGSGIGHALADKLVAIEYVEKFLGSHFYRGARPPVLIATKLPEEADMDHFDQSWKEKARRGLAMVLDGDANQTKLWELGYNMEQQQVGPISRGHQAAVMETFGYSPELSGKLDGGANRSTINMAEEINAKNNVVPRLERACGVYSRLARRYRNLSGNAVLCHEDPVKEDRTEYLSGHRAAPWTSSMDEFRERGLGLKPLKGGMGRFHVLKGRLWDPETGQYAEQKEIVH